MTATTIVERLTFAALGLALMSLDYSLRQHGTRASGTVVGHDEAPIVQFFLPDGRALKVKPAHGPSRRYHLPGASVALFYNPDDPQDFVLDTFEHRLMPGFYLLFGLGGLFAPFIDACKQSAGFAGNIPRQPAEPRRFRAGAPRPPPAMPDYLTHLDSPVGRLRLVATDQGLAAVLWEDEDFSRAKLPAPTPAANHPILRETARQLTEYFGQERTSFTVPLDVAGTAFQQQVWAALRTIPFGQSKSYGELARLMGAPNAVRAVGGALNKNPVAIIVPCHRVIGASGQLVGFAGGLAHKTRLLQLENLVPRSLFD